MKKAAIKGIEYYLPEIVLDNRTLSENFPKWTPEKIVAKTGIEERRIANDDECASDLAEQAANKLFASQVCSPDEVEFILLCTQSPDYFLPTTACILQEKLGVPTTAGALDFNLGCSGYIYGLSLAKGLIETGQVNNVLLLTAETYSKYIQPSDMNVRAIFGDGAAATFISTQESENDMLGPFVFGTDGSGKDKLIVEDGGLRSPNTGFNRLHMNGPEIFAFTIDSVPKAVDKLLVQSEMTKDDVDLFVFHQANEFMLNHLRKKIKIPNDKFYINMKNTGNTVSSTIPIALNHLLHDGDGKISGDLNIMLVGFGVGYSWAATMCRIKL